MSKYDGATIEIVNWEKYHPRAESKKPSWFRCENDLAGKSMFGIDCQHRWIWIVVLCEASKKNGQPFEWNCKWIESTTQISTSTQTEALELFEKRGYLHVTRTRLARGSHDLLRGSCPTDGRTDVHIGSSDDDPTDWISSFEEIYKTYPRRKGSQRKKEIFDKFNRIFDTKEKQEKLLLAAKNYRVFCDREEKTGTTFVLQFATFANGVWEEWVDPPIGGDQPPLIPASQGMAVLDDIERRHNGEVADGAA